MRFLNFVVKKEIKCTCASSLKFKFLQFSRAVLSKVQDSLNISKSCKSLKLLAIFLCLVRDLFASASDT